MYEAMRSLDGATKTSDSADGIGHCGILVRLGADHRWISELASATTGDGCLGLFTSCQTGGVHSAETATTHATTIGAVPGANASDD